jgi:hypothetical protein
MGASSQSRKKVMKFVENLIGKNDMRGENYYLPDVIENFRRQQEGKPLIQFEKEEEEEEEKEKQELFNNLEPLRYDLFYSPELNVTVAAASQKRAGKTLEFLKGKNVGFFIKGKDDSLNKFSFGVVDGANITRSPSKFFELIDASTLSFDGKKLTPEQTQQFIDMHISYDMGASSQSRKEVMKYIESLEGKVTINGKQFSRRDIARAEGNHIHDVIENFTRQKNGEDLIIFENVKIGGEEEEEFEPVPKPISRQQEESEED